MRSKLTGFFLLLLIYSGVFACNSRTLVTDPAKLREIEGILQAIPVHPDMNEVAAAPTSSGESLLGKRYKSALPLAEARSFYVEKLVEQGWRFDGEEAVKDRGRNKGERLLVFSRAGYRLDVKYAGERAGELGWRYSVQIRPTP